MKFCPGPQFAHLCIDDRVKKKERKKGKEGRNVTISIEPH